MAAAEDQRRLEREPDNRFICRAILARQRGRLFVDFASFCSHSHNGPGTKTRPEEVIRVDGTRCARPSRGAFD